MNFKQLLSEVHASSLKMGLWNGYTDNRQAMMKMIEVAVSCNQTTIKQRANLVQYYKELPVAPQTAYQYNIAGTFEDITATLFIMATDYGAMHCPTKIGTIERNFDKEIKAMKKVPIPSLAEHIFIIINSIQNLQHLPFKSQTVGELLGRIFYLSHFYEFKPGLNKFIEMRLKYMTVTVPQDPQKTTTNE